MNLHEENAEVISLSAVLAGAREELHLQFNSIQDMKAKSNEMMYWRNFQCKTSKSGTAGSDSFL
jgi:hypothetical protein